VVKLVRAPPDALRSKSASKWTTKEVTVPSALCTPRLKPTREQPHTKSQSRVGTNPAADLAVSVNGAVKSRSASHVEVTSTLRKAHGDEIIALLGTTCGHYQA